MFCRNQYVNLALWYKRYVDRTFYLRRSKEPLRTKLTSELTSSLAIGWHLNKHTSLEEPLRRAVLIVLQTGILDGFKSKKSFYNLDINPNKWTDEEAASIPLDLQAGYTFILVLLLGHWFSSVVVALNQLLQVKSLKTKIKEKRKKYCSFLSIFVVLVSLTSTFAYIYQNYVERKMSQFALLSKEIDSTGKLH